MFERIGFRHALAFAQLLLFLVVMIPYEFQRYEMRHPAENANGDLLDLAKLAAPEWVRVCGIVNAPAWIVFAGLGRFLPERLSWLVFTFIGGGVFLQWYFVGLWRDQRVGAISGGRTELSARGRIFAWVGIVVAGIAGVLAIGAQVFYLEDSDSFLISLAVWCGFFVVMLFAQIRWKSPEKSGASILTL
jgi:hypothetical protein